MNRPTLAQRYSDVAIALHWVLALALLVSFCVGLYMSDLRLSPTRIRLFNWHKWAGISILLLSAFRLAWRLTHRPPELPPGMSLLKRRLSQVAHGLLYVLFFVVPLSGWAYSSAAGFPVVWFGKIPLPDFVPVDKDLAGILKNVHDTLTLCLGGLVAVHVAAALQHQFLDRDGLLLRMIPTRRDSARG